MTIYQLRKLIKGARDNASVIRRKIKAGKRVRTSAEYWDNVAKGHKEQLTKMLATMADK